MQGQKHARNIKHKQYWFLQKEAKWNNDDTTYEEVPKNRVTGAINKYHRIMRDKGYIRDYDGSAPPSWSPTDRNYRDHGGHNPGQSSSSRHENKSSSQHQHFYTVEQMAEYREIKEAMLEQFPLQAKAEQIKEMENWAWDEFVARMEKRRLNDLADTDQAVIHNEKKDKQRSITLSPRASTPPKVDSQEKELLLQIAANKLEEIEKKRLQKVAELETEHRKKLAAIRNSTVQDMMMEIEQKDSRTYSTQAHSDSGAAPSHHTSQDTNKEEWKQGWRKTKDWKASSWQDDKWHNKSDQSWGSKDPDWQW